MLEIYDRVLPSRNIPTLVGLSALALGLYGFLALFDLLRSRVLIRIARRLAQKLSPHVYYTIGQLVLRMRQQGDGMQPMRDLDQIKAFMSGSGPLAFLDMPWMPFYIGICFLFHVWLGVTALIGAIILIGFTLITELYTRGPTKVATIHGNVRNSLVEFRAAIRKCCRRWEWLRTCTPNGPRSMTSSSTPNSVPPTSAAASAQFPRRCA